MKDQRINQGTVERGFSGTIWYSTKYKMHFFMPDPHTTMSLNEVEYLAERMKQATQTPPSEPRTSRHKGIGTAILDDDTPSIMPTYEELLKNIKKK